MLFKGSGFYATDYRSEGYKAAEKKAGAFSSSSGAKKETKSADTAKPKDGGAAPAKSD